MLRQALKGIWESYSSRLQKKIIEKEFKENMWEAYSHKFGNFETLKIFVDKGYELLSKAKEFNIKRKARPIDTGRMEQSLFSAEEWLDDLYFV